MHMALFFLGLGISVLIFLPAASATSAKDSFQRYGLLGTWAVDCTKPASRSNPHVAYRLVDADRVQRQTSIEPGKVFDLSSVVESVSESGPTELVVYWKTREGGITNRIVLQGDQMQVTESTRDNGEKLVANGRAVRDNREAPRFRRCNAGPSSNVDVAPRVTSRYAPNGRTARRQEA